MEEIIRSVSVVKKARHNIVVALPALAPMLTSLSLYFRLNSTFETGLRVVDLDDMKQ